MKRDFRTVESGSCVFFYGAVYCRFRFVGRSFVCVVRGFFVRLTFRRRRMTVRFGVGFF